VFPLGVYWFSFSRQAPPAVLGRQPQPHPGNNGAALASCGHNLSVNPSSVEVRDDAADPTAVLSEEIEERTAPSNGAEADKSHRRTNLAK